VHCDYRPDLTDELWLRAEHLVETLGQPVSAAGK
jgi:hypothetical protein